MDRWIPALVLFAILSSVIVGIEGMRDDDDETTTDLVAQLDRIEERIGSLEQSIARVDDRVGAVSEEQRVVQSTVEKLDARTQNLAAQRDTTELARASYGDESVLKETASAEQADEFRTLLATVFSGDNEDFASPENERFWQLARNEDIMARVLADLEGDVDVDPDDLESRMELASVYVAKLLTVASGPERGIWSSKAEAQWTEVADRDPEHWDAHFALGSNYSYYPPFLNRQKDAIEWLQKSESLLERAVPEDKHTQNYIRLALVQQQTGAVDEARKTIERGLVRHPDSDELEQALEALKGSK